MLKETLYALSAVLALSGGYLIMRDLLSNKQAPRPSVPKPPSAFADIESESGDFAEVTIKPVAPGISPARATPPDAIARLGATIQSILSEMDDGEAEAPRDPRLEKGFDLAASMLERAVRGLDPVLETVHTSIGPAGAPSWSFNNRGYGTFRRILVAGDSIAWLRLELTHAGTLAAVVKSHNDERSLLNANESIPARDMTIAAVQSVIADALQPLVKFAARNASRLLAQREEASDAWTEIANTVREAVGLTNRTLAADDIVVGQDARTEWDQSLGQYRHVSMVSRSREEIARLSVVRDGRSLTVAVVPSHGRFPELIRQRQLDVSKATPTIVAAAIADCLRPIMTSSARSTRRAPKS